MLLSRVSGEGLTIATWRFHCCSNVIFGFRKNRKVCNNGCASQVHAIGCLCSHFTVTASALYEAAAISGSISGESISGETILVLALYIKLQQSWVSRIIIFSSTMASPQKTALRL